MLSANRGGAVPLNISLSQSFSASGARAAADVRRARLLRARVPQPDKRGRRVQGARGVRIHSNAEVESNRDLYCERRGAESERAAAFLCCRVACALSLLPRSTHDCSNRTARTLNPSTSRSSALTRTSASSPPRSSGAPCAPPRASRPSLTGWRTTHSPATESSQWWARP